MRSRYSAYTRGDLEYLEQSWHPDFRPPDLQLDPGICWLGLAVFSHEQRDDRATVEFEARLLAGGRVDAIHEKSRFLRLQGRWLYTDGDRLLPTFESWKPGRNEACPCGSGFKFKRCCGAGR